MRWSQLKKRLEDNIADSVRGRVEVGQTRYRKAHDQEGEAWITLDGKRVLSMGSATYLEKLGKIVNQSHSNGASWGESYSQAWPIMNASGLFLLEQLNKTLFQSLNLPIEQIVAHENLVVRGLGLLDKRFGIRRLKSFDVSNEHPFVQLMYRTRCEAEKISSPPFNQDRLKSAC